MKRISVLILDALYCIAWLGVTATVIAIVNSLIGSWQSPAGKLNLLGPLGNQIFWLTVVLWIGLTGAMFIDWFFNNSLDARKSNLWIRILLAHVFIVGPTSYYLGELRTRLLGATELNMLGIFQRFRAILKTLYILFFWGAAGFVSCGIGLLLLADSIESAQILAIPMFLLLPVSGVPTFLLMSFFLVDAVERYHKVSEKGDILRLLNPWSWVFGIRKYYFQILRPDLSHMK